MQAKVVKKRTPGGNAQYLKAKGVKQIGANKRTNEAATHENSYALSSLKPRHIDTLRFSTTEKKAWRGEDEKISSRCKTV